MRWDKIIINQDTIKTDIQSYIVVREKHLFPTADYPHNPSITAPDGWYSHICNINSIREIQRPDF